MTKKIQGMAIYVDKPPALVEVDQDTGGNNTTVWLQQWRDIIGGGWLERIEVFPLLDGRTKASAYIDEEGKLKHQPFNHVATVLFNGTAQASLWKDVVVGTMVVFGLPIHAPDGDVLEDSIQEDFAEHIRLLYKRLVG